MLGVFQPDPAGDLGQGEGGSLHQLDGPVDPVNIDIVARRDVHVSREQLSEISGGYVHFFCDILQKYFMHVIVFDIIQGEGDILLLKLGLGADRTVRTGAVQNMHEQTEQERVDLSGRMGAGLIHADDGFCERFQFAVSSLTVAGGGGEQQGMDQVDRRILAGEDPGEKPCKKVNVAESAFIAAIQIERVHHIGENHDKVPL